MNTAPKVAPSPTAVTDASCITPLARKRSRTTPRSWTPS
jgi:hypothetical protein